ncbi:hypothetical protein VTN49DRAFT_7893 [Thermomyces lanuginosus]|uniref:uncharacterized protein n=1 Tax=Thermomyces lanuginosus TaxID=5541 RepID=UPI003742CC24
MAGRPSKDLSRYKEEILQLVNRGYTYESITHHLADQHHVQVADRTLRRQCSIWGVQKHRKPVDSPQLRARIATLFNESSLQDPDILRVLEREGYSIGARTLRRIRRRMGLYQRASPGEELEVRFMWRYA